MRNDARQQQLKRIAVVGTLHRSSETVPEKDLWLSIEHSIYSDETLLLLEYAQLALRAQSGYVPPKQKFSHQIPCAADLLPVMKQEASGLLAMILETVSMHVVLPEMAVHAALVGQRACEELIPTILDAGYRLTQLRKFLGFLLGHRGIWLARINGGKRWRWALEWDFEEPRSLMRPDSAKEAQIIRFLMTRSLDTTGTHEGLNLLSTYQRPWSNTLAQTFLQAIDDAFGYATIKQHGQLISALKRCANSFPLEHAHTLIAVLQNIGNSEMVVDHLEPIFELRRSVLTVLYVDNLTGHDDTF